MFGMLISDSTSPTRLALQNFQRFGSVAGFIDRGQRDFRLA